MTDNQTIPIILKNEKQQKQLTINIQKNAKKNNPNKLDVYFKFFSCIMEKN